MSSRDLLIITPNFHKGQRTFLTSLECFDPVSNWGNKKLVILLSNFTMEDTGSPAFEEDKAARVEWLTLKSLVLEQKYPQDRIDNL